MNIIAEGINELLGWFSSMFEAKNWYYRQRNDRWWEEGKLDTFGGTYAAPPIHFWIKNFAYLSYWHLFQYVSYNQEEVHIYPQEEIHGSNCRTCLSKRFQEPLNLLISPTASYGWFKLYDRRDPRPTSFPWESSNLSIPLLANPIYPVWMPNLPCIFGQKKITGIELYGSLYYLEDRISYIMQDAAIWLKSNSSLDPSNPYNLASFDMFIDLAQARYDPLRLYCTTIGNLEKWTVSNYSDSMSWWSWYQTIPWARAQAFPDPAKIEQRIGWNIPVMSDIPVYSSYIDGDPNNVIYPDSFVKFTRNYTQEPSCNHDIVYGAYSKHTLFFGTAHYPLGTIQIAVKRK